MTVGARYCPRCGTALPGAPPVVCFACAYALFVNPRPAGTAIIVRDGAVLTLRRAIDPHRGRWELPGGFCDGFEHPADAIVREAREELRVTIRLDEYVGMYIGEYDFQDERLPVLDCFWLASIVDGEVDINRAEASDYAWFDLDEVPELAFATMNRAMGAARERLVGRV